MKTLEYYWKDGTHTVFDGYTIDEHSIIRNKQGRVIARIRSGGYYRVGVRHKGKDHKIRVCRALASTFIGKPPTLKHTVDHEDNNKTNDTLENIRWLCKAGQSKNRTMPTENKFAFIIVKDGVELTAKDWVKVYKKPDGGKYDKDTILNYARKQTNGFRYKVFTDLSGEEWKVVPGSKNKKGEWFISNMNRMKYKTSHAENVVDTNRLSMNGDGYPQVDINGKHVLCHVLSMMIFHPEEYAAKCLEFIILHENDDKNDFRPSKLRWGTPHENGKDAHKNGKHDGTKRAQKPVASYVNGKIEQEHESLRAAARYLQENGYSDANASCVSYASENDIVKYDRVWKFIVK